MAMTQAERRIRRLRISGRGDDMLKARYLLEETFRVASLPGLPPNATVVVRRLDLGRINTRFSPGRLAAIVSETMRNQAVGAVCIDRQSAAEASVVWFSDELRPYQVLLQRLLDGKATREWYWTSLFPGQHLILNEQLILQLMINACHTPVQGLAIPLLIQACLEPIRLSRLFPFLTALSVRRLMREQGVTPAVLSGLPDSRSKIEATVFSATGGGQAIGVPNLAVAWRYAVRTAVQHWGLGDVRTRWLALQALVCFRPGYLERGDVWQRIDVRHWLNAWSTSDCSVKHEQSDGCGSDAPIDKRKVVEVSPRACAYDDVFRETHASHSADPGIESFMEPIFPPADEGEGSRGSQQNDRRQEALNSNKIHRVSDALLGRFSRDAGFALLIPLLQRLAMGDLLQRHDVLLELDFPRQLLLAMAIRFKMEASDPVWRLFESVKNTPKAVVERFSAPAAWRRLYDFPHVQNGVLPLPATNQQFEQLITDFQLSSAIFLRRHCALSLRGLIQRPGRVSMTDTHWDVVFNLNQTDLRLRRVALDTDPGWIAWIGKVVQFHFVGEG